MSDLLPRRLACVTKIFEMVSVSREGSQIVLPSKKSDTYPCSTQDAVNIRASITTYFFPHTKNHIRATRWICWPPVTYRGVRSSRPWEQGCGSEPPNSILSRQPTQLRYSRYAPAHPEAGHSFPSVLPILRLTHWHVWYFIKRDPWARHLPAKPARAFNIPNMAS